MHEVTGIFGIYLPLIVLALEAFQRSLCKEVAVPLPLLAFPDVVDNGSRQAALGIIIVGLSCPHAFIHLAKDRSFQSQALDVSVLSGGCGVPGHRPVAEHTTIAEGIFSRRCHKLSAERRGDAWCPLLFPEDRRIDKSKRTAFEGSFHVVVLTFSKTGPTCADVNGSAAAIVLCRLENLALLSVI